MMHRFCYILGLHSKCGKGLDAWIGEKIDVGEVRNEVEVEVKMTKEAISYRYLCVCDVNWEDGMM